jgi:hypothetical protein
LAEVRAFNLDIDEVPLARLFSRTVDVGVSVLVTSVAIRQNNLEKLLHRDLLASDRKQDCGFLNAEIKTR